VRTFLPPEVQLLDAVMGVPSRFVIPLPPLTAFLPDSQSSPMRHLFVVFCTPCALCKPRSASVEQSGVADETACCDVLHGTDGLQPASQTMETQSFGAG